MSERDQQPPAIHELMAEVESLREKIKGHELVDAIANAASPSWCYECERHHADAKEWHRMCEELDRTTNKAIRLSDERDTLRAEVERWRAKVSRMRRRAEKAQKSHADRTQENDES